MKKPNRDAVLQQVETTYDSNSHIILVTAKQRFHDETGTGALGTASTGVKARVSYAASYFDGADRLTGVVDVGTNGGTSYTRPSTLPSRSDTVLVTTTAYNSAGLAWKRIDPRGIETRGYFNALGDVTKSIENYVDGTVSDTDDKTTESTYNAAGLTTVRVVLPSGGQQVTEWVYGVTTSGGSGLNSNDLGKEVRYPDPSTGASSSSSKDVLTVNALGQALTMTDRNGTVHTYSYDVVGRQTADAITTLGSGVDGTVRRLTTAYDTQGNPYLFTAYDASSGGNIVNQVKRDFNGLGQLTSEWQSHSGAVTGSSPRVQYAYSEMPSGANHSRLTSVTYASGYTVNYNYASGLDANISRLSSLSDSSNTLEAYSYLGLGTVVKRAHSQPGVDLTYIKLSTESVGDAGDQYSGLDRFGRVVDQRWINSSNTYVDRYQYGYDRDGNRLYKDNKVLSSLSEVYTYDSLNQVASYKLGTLNSGKTDVTGSPSTSQSWDYDAVGNWDSITTNSTTQTRSANKQNEITSVSGATTPTYDSNGNLTTDENNYRFVYDAWNRVVQVKNSSNVVIVTYGRDALHRHVTDTVGSTVTDRFFSGDWQLLETKVGSNTVTRNVWSPVYVDGLVLRDRDTDSNGTLDERLYALQDANWNTTALVNTSGTVQERYTYTSFGQVTFRDSTGSTLSNSAKDWIFLHQGGEKIAAGDYEFRNRLYSPSLGRWLSNDPLGFKAGDQNWYRAVGNNPANMLDPSGLEEFDFLKRPVSQMSPNEFHDWLVGQPGTPINIPPFYRPTRDPFDPLPAMPPAYPNQTKVGAILIGSIGIGQILPSDWLKPYEEFQPIFPQFINDPLKALSGGPINIAWEPLSPAGAITVGNPQPGKVVTVGGAVVVDNPKFNLEFGFLYDMYDNNLKADIKAVIGLGPGIQVTTGGSYINNPEEGMTPSFDIGISWLPGKGNNLRPDFRFHFPNLIPNELKINTHITNPSSSGLEYDIKLWGGWRW